MELIIVVIYAYLGSKANDYLKYTLLGITAEAYHSILYYLTWKLFWGAFLGWATIPIAIFIKILKVIF